jgi:hypothetical protein
MSFGDPFPAHLQDSRVSCRTLAADFLLLPGNIGNARVADAVVSWSMGEHTASGFCASIAALDIESFVIKDQSE